MLHSDRKLSNFSALQGDPKVLGQFIEIISKRHNININKKLCCLKR